MSSIKNDFLKWNLKDIDTSLPEYKFREDFALKLYNYEVEKVLSEAVYMTADEMSALVTQTQAEVLKSLQFKGTGLELGAGTGLLSSTLANLEDVKKMYSVEIVSNMAEFIIPKVSKKISKKNSPKVQPVCGSFDYLEVEESSIDFIVEIGSLHHSPDLSATLKESSRVLKKGGFLLCFDRSHDDKISDQEINAMLSIQYSDAFLEANGYPLNETLTRSQNGEHEIRLSEWKRDFEGAGLELIDIRYFIKPSMKRLMKGLLFALPYTIRKNLYNTVNMGNYQKQINYFLRKLPFVNAKEVYSSIIDSTVFLAVKK